MRVSVAFHTVTVLVPCGDGTCTVAELIEKAVTRYKNCVGKPADHEIKVKNLRLANGSGYIDNEDQVADVLDDKELVIADFEEPGVFDTSSITSYDSVPNFGSHGNPTGIPGTAPSLTSNDNDDPVLDRPTLWEEANLGRRRWSGSQTTDSENRLPSPSRESLPLDLTSLYSGRKDFDPTFMKVRGAAGGGGRMDPGSMRSRYPGPSRRDILTKRSRPSWGSGMNDSPTHDPSLIKTFGRSPLIPRSGGIYRPRSHDFLDMDPDSDLFNSHLPDSYYLSQPSFSAVSYEHSSRANGPSGFSLSQPTGRHVSFLDRPLELGPRDKHDRPSSSHAGGGSSMIPLREEPGELRSSEDEVKKLDEEARVSETESTVSDKEYGGFSRSNRKSIRDGAVAEQWERAVEEGALDGHDSELTVNEDSDHSFVVDALAMDHPSSQTSDYATLRPSDPSLTFTPDFQGASQLSSDVPSDVNTDIVQSLGRIESHEEKNSPLNTLADVVSPSSDVVVEPQKEVIGDEEEEEEEELSNIQIIELHKGNSYLGVHLKKVVSRHGRDAGIYISKLDPNGFVAQSDSKELKVNDRILACNGADFTKLPNSKAEQVFCEMMDDPLLRIAVSRPLATNEDVSEEDPGNSEKEASAAANSVLPNAARNTFTNTRQLGRIHVIILRKGAQSLGFALTSRDIAANDGERLIYIKSITPGGVAFDDGRLKIGDRLLKVNEEDITGYSRQEVAELLRRSQGSVTLSVSRQEQGAGEEEEEGSVAMEAPIAIGKSVMTLNIPMQDSGPAGLGITVHGRVNPPNSAHSSHFCGDAGVYIKSIVTAGVAALDGRLQVNDQLLSVNGQSLVGKSNDEAMETLKKALGQITKQVQLVIARKSGSKLKRTDSQCTNEEEEGRPQREVGIDIGPSQSSQGTSFIPSCSQESGMGSSYTPQTYRRGDVKLSQSSTLSDLEVVQLSLGDEEGHMKGRGEYPGPMRSGCVQKTNSSNSLSQGSDKHRMAYVPEGSSPSSSPRHMVYSPRHGELPSKIGSPTWHSRGQFHHGGHTRHGSLEPDLHRRSPALPAHPAHPNPKSKYSPRTTPSPLTSPQSKTSPPIHCQEDFHTLPKTKHKSHEGHTEDSYDELESVSDSEVSSVFQRDAPERISIKKGKGLPKSLQKMSNNESKFSDEVPMIGEMSHSMDELMTQESRDTGIDMSFSVDSLRTAVTSQAHYMEHSGAARSLQDSRSQPISHSGNGDVKGAKVSDTKSRQNVGSFQEPDERKKKKKGIFKGIFKRGKKGKPRLESFDDDLLPPLEGTQEVPRRRNSASQVSSAHQRFSLSVLDAYDDGTIPEVMANV